MNALRAPGVAFPAASRRAPWRAAPPLPWLMLMLLAAAQASTARAAEAPRPALRDCPDCPEMVVLPAGAFLLGTAADAYEHDERSGETPPLPVRIREPFALGRFELLQREFAQFVAATGHRPAQSCALEQGPGDRTPARCLAPADAAAYVAWLSARTGRRYRLPSEAEWEYAARAGSSGARSWSNRDSHEGVSISRACDYANVYDVSARGLALPVPHARCTDRFAGLAPAGSFAPNPWGLHDTIGNLRELVADCFTRSYKGRPADERAWTWTDCSQRVLRGGSWRSRPFAARSAARDFVAVRGSAGALQDAGLRLARELEPGERPAGEAQAAPR